MGAALVLVSGYLVGSLGSTTSIEHSQGQRETSTLSFLSELGLGALFGALVGAFGTHLLREQAERRREVRERDGLLRLLVGEIMLNRATAERFLQEPEVIYSAGGQAASAEEWLASRVRLSQLVPREDFPKLVEYYQFVMVLQHHIKNYLDAMRRTDRALAAFWFRTARDQINQIMNLQDRAMDIIEKYLGVVDPRRLKQPSEEAGKGQPGPPS
jgi:hypothetical protein